MARAFALVASIVTILGASVGCCEPASAQGHDENVATCRNDRALEASIAACSALIKSGRENSESLASAFLHRGYDYNRDRQYDLAIADETEAIRLKPDFFDAYFIRGAAYLGKKLYDLAIADETDAIRIKPDSGDALLFRGFAYENKDLLDLAIADFGAAIRLNPGDENAYFARASVYAKKKQFDLAIADDSEGLRLKPDDYSALVDRGNAHGEKREYDLAIADYSEAIRQKPDNYRAYDNRADAYTFSDRYDLAIADETVVARLKPGYAENFIIRGSNHLQKHEYDLAIADETEAIRLKPDAFMAISIRCFVRAVGGRELDLALADCTNLLQRDPKNPNCLEARGLVYFEMREYAKALIDFDAALAAKPRFAMALFERGVTRLRTGDPRGGDADMALARSIDPKIGIEYARFRERP